MNLSNSIAQMILDMLSENDQIEIQRNILAQDLGCVPSQINYVLSSRFTPEKGYIVESKRGGKGFIKISRISFDKNTLLMNIISELQSFIDEKTVHSHLLNLTYNEIINSREAQIILSACSDNALKELPPDIRNYIRSGIFKEALLSLTNF